MGSEIYAPIFRAGLFLVLSGFLSALVAGLIVNSTDSWDELGLEFEKGKEAQLIPEALPETAAESQTRLTQESLDAKGSDEMKYLDL